MKILKRCFAGKTTNQIIGHPAMCPLKVENDCILTKFAGTIDAGDMKADIQFDLKPFKSYRQHLLVPSKAHSHFALILFVCLAGCWTGDSMVACRTRIVQPQELPRYLGKVLLPPVGLYAIGSAILFASLPKLASADVVHRRDGLGVSLRCFCVKASKMR